MPALHCPPGADCTMGPPVAIWFTVDVAFSDAKALLDDHVIIAHQAVAAGPAPERLGTEKLADLN